MKQKVEYNHTKNVRHIMKIGKNICSNLIKNNITGMISDIEKREGKLKKNLDSIKTEIKRVGIYN